MAVLRTRSVRTTQPTGAARIDRANPLTRNLVSTLFYNGTYPPMDIPIGLPWVNPYGASDPSHTVRLGKGGRVLVTRYGGYRLTQIAPAERHDFTRGATSLLALTVKISNNGVLMTVSSTGWYIAQIALLGGYFVAQELRSPATTVTDTAAFVVDREYIVVARSSGSMLSLFVDGIKVAETASVFGNNSYRRSVEHTNNDVTGGVEVKVALAFNVALTDNEIFSLSNNPWQVFEGTQRTLVIPDASVALPTLAYPSATNSAGAWTSTAGTLHDAINEPTTPNDASYISVSSGSVCDFTLDNTAFPCGANVELKTRGSSVNGSTLTVRLYQGATTIMTRAITLTATDTTYTHALTAPEIALIVAGAISGTLTTS